MAEITFKAIPFRQTWRTFFSCGTRAGTTTALRPAAKKGKSMGIVAVIADSREPGWVQQMKLNGVPVAVDTLPAGDVQLFLDDGQVLLVERKVSGDFLGSIADGRLFDQASRLVESRISDQLNGKPISVWPYLIITGTLRPSGKDLVITDRGETAWDWESVNSAILTLQEMGVFVGFARDDDDFERALLALGNRKREDVKIMPARQSYLVSQQALFLMGIPGIGEERSTRVLEWAGGNLTNALIGLTDLSLSSPVSKSLRSSIRHFFGLNDGTILDIKAE